MVSKDEYKKVLCDHITVSCEDLADNETELINKSYNILISNLADLKAEKDEVKRLSIELANLKAMTDNKDERINDNYIVNDICPTCGRDESYRNDF